MCGAYGKTGSLAVSWVMCREGLLVTEVLEDKVFTDGMIDQKVELALLERRRRCKIRGVCQK